MRNKKTILMMLLGVVVGFFLRGTKKGAEIAAKLPITKNQTGA